MSDDLISRDAVEEIISDIRDCISVEGYCAILERLKKLPSVNPQEPKKGHWKKLNVGYGCSECSLATNKSGRDFYRYCPNCGAIMIESEE